MYLNACLRSCATLLRNGSLKMVTEVTENSYSLEDIFSKDQIKQIFKNLFDEQSSCRLTESHVTPATNETVGFLGEHLRVKLTVELGGNLKDVNLFVKRLPVDKDKRDFVEEFSFFTREITMLNLLKEMSSATGPNQFYCDAVLNTETCIVMQDLAVEGYKMRPHTEEFDLKHFLVATTAIARLHAASANYETKKTNEKQHKYTILQDHRNILFDTHFTNAQYLSTVAKSTAKFIEEFSEKFKGKIPDLETSVFKSMVQLSENFREHRNTVNTLLHKDLWNNNILFKYEENEPTNAVLVDFQCAFYGPPAFDLMILLYENSTKEFRDRHENDVFRHYYSVFTDLLDSATVDRLKSVKYDYEEFLKWCELSRYFGAMVSLALLPYILMDRKIVAETLNAPEQFVKCINDDRSGPVIAYARNCKTFRDRYLEISEEYVERSVLKYVVK